MDPLQNSTPVNTSEMPMQTEAPKGEKKAKTSLILGIIGLLAWLLPIIGLPVTIVGLVLGIKGRTSSKERLAKIGIILCIIGLVLTIINASIGAYLGAIGQNEAVNAILGE